MKYLLILFLLMASFARAEDFPVQVGGEIEIENKTYFREPDPDLVDNGRNQLRLLLKLKSSTERKLRFLSALELRADEVNPDRDRIYLKEGYIHYEEKNSDLRIGKQVYSWGKADRINPTNNLNPRDYQDFFDTDGEEIGVISLSSRYYREKTIVETVVIPFFEPAVLPAFNSRWNLLPGSLANFPKEEERPSNTLENTQLAARISMSSGGWDYSASYYRGFEKFPAVFIIPNPDTLHFKYRKLQVWGLDFATSFDKLGLRGEAGYLIPGGLSEENQGGNEPYLQYVLGLDYNFTNLIGEQGLYLLGQWVQEISFPENDLSRQSDNDFNHFFNKVTMLKAEWAFTAFTKLSLQSIYRLKSKGIYLQPLISSNLIDNVNIESGLDIFYGREGSLFKGFQDNKRIFGRIKYSF